MRNCICYIYSLCIRILVSRKIRWAGHVAHMGRMIIRYTFFFVKKPGRKIPHGVLRSRSEVDLNINTEHVVASVGQCDSSILNTDSAAVRYISWGMLEITI
jgi:hypothetical protein